MAHEALDDSAVGACTQEAGGEEVPELMGCSWGVGAVERVANDSADGLGLYGRGRV